MSYGPSYLERCYDLAATRSRSSTAQYLAPWTE